MMTLRKENERTGTGNVQIYHTTIEIMLDTRPIPFDARKDSYCDNHSIKRSDDCHQFHVSVDLVIIAGNGSASKVAVAAFRALRNAW